MSLPPETIALRRDRKGQEKLDKLRKELKTKTQCLGRRDQVIANLKESNKALYQANKEWEKKISELELKMIKIRALTS